MTLIIESVLLYEEFPVSSFKEFQVSKTTFKFGPVFEHPDL
jgi:hypothetical protein